MTRVHQQFWQQAGDVDPPSNPSHHTSAVATRASLQPFSHVAEWISSYRQGYIQSHNRMNIIIQPRLHSVMWQNDYHHTATVTFSHVAEWISSYRHGYIQSCSRMIIIIQTGLHSVTWQNDHHHTATVTFSHIAEWLSPHRQGYIQSRGRMIIIIQPRLHSVTWQNIILIQPQLHSVCTAVSQSLVIWDF